MSEAAEKVTQFPGAETKRPEPVKFVITHSLPNGRQITAECIHREGGDAWPTINSVCDTLDKVRARYEIGIVYGEESTLDYEIAAHEEAMSRAEAELKKLDEETDAQIAALRDEMGKAVDAFKTTFAAGQAKAEEAGRTYDPDKGANKRDLHAHVQRKTECEEKIKKLEAERQKGHENHAVNMTKFADELADRKAKKDARLKLLGQ